MSETTNSTECGQLVMAFSLPTQWRSKGKGTRSRALALGTHHTLFNHLKTRF